LRLWEAQAPHLEQRVGESFERARRAFRVGGRLWQGTEHRAHDFHRRQFLLDRPLQSIGDRKLDGRIAVGTCSPRLNADTIRFGLVHRDRGLRFGPNRPLGLCQEPQVWREIAARAILTQPPSLVLGQSVQCLAMDAKIRGDRVLGFVRFLVAVARVLYGLGREAT